MGRSLLLLFVFTFLFSSKTFSSVHLDWGVVNLELKPTGKNSFLGIASINITQVRNLGKVGFQLYDNDIAVSSFEEKHVYLYKSASKSNIELTLHDKFDKLSDVAFNKIVIDVAAGDEVICYLKSTSGNMYTTIVHVIADLPSYRQPLTVPLFSKITHFKYQLVTLSTGNQVLKLDTTLASNKPILDAYRRIPKVRINNIPNFETTVNFISETDSVIVLGKRNLTIHPVNAPKGDYFSKTSEPKDLTEAGQISMDWNKMVASPDSPIFSLDFIKNTKSHTINLTIGGKKYEITSMRFTLYDGQKLNRAYHWSVPDTYPLEELQKLDEPYSVLIDRIIIKDNNHGFVYLPQAFIYNFE